MYENSKIITFCIEFADTMERAYRCSSVCIWAKSFGRTMLNIWHDSITGQIIDRMFSIEAHRNSAIYKLTARAFSACMSFISEKLNLEKGISESKYISLIKSFFVRSRKPENDESRIKAVLMDSLFVRCLYEFWEGTD